MKRSQFVKGHMPALLRIFAVLQTGEELDVCEICHRANVARHTTDMYIKELFLLDLVERVGLCSSSRGSIWRFKEKSWLSKVAESRIRVKWVKKIT